MERARKRKHKHAPKISLRKNKKNKKIKEEGGTDDDDDEVHDSPIRTSKYMKEADIVPEGRKELSLSREMIPASLFMEKLKEKMIIGNEEHKRRIHLKRCEGDPMYTFFFFSDNTDTNQQQLDDEGNQQSIP